MKNSVLDQPEVEQIRALANDEKLAEDPQAFLSQLGIHLDDESARSIRAQLETRKMVTRTKAIQAGTIHIDL